MTNSPGGNKTGTLLHLVVHLLNPLATTTEIHVELGQTGETVIEIGIGMERTSLGIQAEDIVVLEEELEAEEDRFEDQLLVGTAVVAEEEEENILMTLVAGTRAPLIANKQLPSSNLSIVALHPRQSLGQMM